MSRRIRIKKEKLIMLLADAYMAGKHQAISMAMNDFDMSDLAYSYYSEIKNNTKEYYNTYWNRMNKLEKS